MESSNTQIAAGKVSSPLFADLCLLLSAMAGVSGYYAIDHLLEHKRFDYHLGIQLMFVSLFFMVFKVIRAAYIQNR